MKTTNSKLILLSLFTTGILLFSSCEKENPEVYEIKQNELETNAKNRESETDAVGYCSTNSRSSCDDNLTHDGCNFTSGEGRDTAYRYTMVDLLDNCYTQPLPSNCSWVNNTTQTRDIYIDLTNCCYSASHLNTQLNNWKNLAIANRPSSSYLITGYEYIVAFPFLGHL